MFKVNSMRRTVVSLIAVLVTCCAGDGEAVAQLPPQSNDGQIAVDVVQLNVTVEVAEQIVELLGQDRVVEEATENVQTAPSKLSGKFFPRKSTINHDGKASIAKVTPAMRKQLLGMIEGAEGSSVTRTLESSSPAGDDAVAFACTQRKYLVGHQPAESMFGLPVNQPVNEFVEDGLVVRYLAQANGTKIGLKASLIVNEMYQVSTYTYELEKGKPLTIELPDCLTRKIEFDTELNPGSELLIVCKHPTRGEKKVTRQKGAFANVPYVNRLFEKPQGIVRLDDNRILFLVKASR